MSNLKVKTILVSQPEPKVENSPYFELQQKHKVKIDFRPFIHVEGVNAKDVRAQKIDLNNFTAIILNSRNSVDHFFRVAEEMRYKVPEDLKYFCQSEAIAFYLQKYVVYRKRKIYVGQKDFIETPLPILSAMFFTVGVVLILLGVISEILMRTYFESQNTTPFSVKDRVNF